MPAEEWPVRVFDQDDPLGGASGFLVDERRVLTCAHVVDGMRQPTVRFPARGDLGDIAAVAEIGPGWSGGADGTGDVAVLTLARPVGVQPARFAAQNALDSGLQELRAVGFPWAAGDVGKIATVTAPQPRLLLQGEWVQLDSVTAFGPLIGRGYSGGAVTIAGTLEVVGMIVMADKGDRSGLMLPVRKLTTYWLELADLIPLGPLQPDAHRDLRRLLSGVTFANPDSVYRAAVGDELLPKLPDVGDLPDRTTAYVIACHIAEGLFLGENAGETVMAALGRLCAEAAEQVADGELRGSLLRWAGRHAGHRGGVVAVGAAAMQGAAYRISVRIGRSGAGVKEILLAVVVARSGAIPKTVFHDRVAAGRVQGVVEQLLPAVIDEHVPHDADLLVEFVLPRPWLSRPVDEWRLGRTVVRLGWRHPVVVRDLARFEHCWDGRERARRWAAIAAPIDRSQIVRWVGCREVVAAKQLAAAFAANTQWAIIALSNAPIPVATNPVIRAGFDSGIPVMLWRRTPCPDSAHDGGPVRCAGEVFQTGFSGLLVDLLAHATIDELPELVRRLRVEADGADEAQPHVGRALTLVWDPPDQPAQPIRLAVASGSVRN